MFNCCTDNTGDIEIQENMRKKQYLKSNLTTKVKSTKKYQTKYELVEFKFEDERNVKIEKSFLGFKDSKKQKFLESYYVNLQNLISYYPITKFPIYNFGEFYFQGYIKDGLRSGYGRMIDVNQQEYYEGEWENDKYHGFGLKINSDNSYVLGEFKNGEIHGHDIVYQKPNGEIYQGDIFDGEENGNAIIKYNSTSYYKGIVKKGERHGFGILVEGDNIYKGNFKNGLLNDKNGRLIIKKNKVIIKEFEGNFKKGILEGKGRIKYATSELFEGNFKKGEKEGHGFLTSKEGKIYGGVWKNDKLNGKGTLTKDGFTIDVEYNENKIEKCL